MYGSTMHVLALFPCPIPSFAMLYCNAGRQLGDKGLILPLIFFLLLMYLILIKCRQARNDSRMHPVVFLSNDECEKI